MKRTEMTKREPEFEKFDDAVKRILSVSKPELKKREEDWQREKEQTQEKRAPSS
jgi:hypothetical protein